MGRNYYPVLQHEEGGKFDLGSCGAHLFTAVANSM